MKIKYYSNDLPKEILIFVLSSIGLFLSIKFFFSLKLVFIPATFFVAYGYFLLEHLFMKYEFLDGEEEFVEKTFSFIFKNNSFISITSLFSYSDVENFEIKSKCRIKINLKDEDEIYISIKPKEVEKFVAELEKRIVKVKELKDKKINI